MAESTAIPDIQIVTADQAENVVFDWGQLTWYADHKLGNSEEMTVGRCVLKPGCGNPRHYHPNCSEILVVVQGQIRHTSAEGKETELMQGDTVTIPRNVWHCAVNIGREDAILFIAFSSAERLTVGEEPPAK